MIAKSCPDPEELLRLIEERLGPVREAEIEAHVEACLLCQGQLETLTARRAWGKADRATHEASSSNGGTPDTPAVEGAARATDLDPDVSVPPPGTMTVDRGGDGATTDFSTCEQSSCTDTEPAEVRATDRTRTFAHGEGGPGEFPVPAQAREHPDWPTIPGYELRQKLGEGGMGVVFLARQIGLNRPAAASPDPPRAPAGPACDRPRTAHFSHSSQDTASGGAGGRAGATASVPPGGATLEVALRAWSLGGGAWA